MIERETIKAGAPSTCEDCDVKLVAEVILSPAGYYVGTQCKCGPYSRESGYYPTEKKALEALRSKEYTR